MMEETSAENEGFKGCWCENSLCNVCHGDGCGNRPSNWVVCDYIGAICDPCAAEMPFEYIHLKV